MKLILFAITTLTLSLPDMVFADDKENTQLLLAGQTQSSSSTAATCISNCPVNAQPQFSSYTNPGKAEGLVRGLLGDSTKENKNPNDETK